MNNQNNKEGGLYEEAAGSTYNQSELESKKPVFEIVENCKSEKEIYSKLENQVESELKEVLSKVNTEEVSAFIGEILKAEKIFLVGVGRVFLSLQCLAKRLAHFGFDVNVVGSIVEKRITEKDLLIVASGSGESMLPVNIAKLAKKHNAKVALITSSRESTLKTISDCVVFLPCPTKTDYNYGVKSIQSMSTLFDQALHIFGDIVCMMVQNRTGKTNEDLKKSHANLE